MSEKDMTLVLQWYRRREEMLRFRGRLVFEQKESPNGTVVEVFVQYGVANQSSNKGLLARITPERYEELKKVKEMNASHFLPTELVKKD